MTKLNDKIKAIALMSSGLDSLLAAKIVSDLGIDVHGLTFYFQFDKLAEKQESGEVADLVRPLGIPITIIDMTDAFLPILLDPAHGYGSGVNPCIDCHLYMLSRAKEMMDETGARFLVTGEVVGQRPMSQHKPTLFHIDKVSGLKGLILRPLSAKLMPPTIPEQEGWIDRQKLYDISGRSRKRQIDLAGALGITRFNAPAGGCILTEPNFSRRVKAFFAHRGKDAVTVDELKLMRLGRHFWPGATLHVIVGRDKQDNGALEAYKMGRWLFRAADTVKSPTVLATGIEDEVDLSVVAGITAKYTRMSEGGLVRIRYERESESGEIWTDPIDDSTLKDWIV